MAAMTITSVCVTSIKPSATIAGGRKFVVTYKVLFTGDYEYLVMIAGGQVGHTLPVIGSILDGDATVRCVSLDGQLTDAPGMAILTAEFSDNPLVAIDTAKDTVEWEFATEDRDITLDANNALITVSSGEIPAGLPRVGGMTAVGCTITGYRSSYKLPPFSKWKVVNSDSLTIDGITVGVGVAWLCGCRTSRQRINGADKIRHSWQLRFKPTETRDGETYSGWDLTLANFGYMAQRAIVGGVEMVPLAFKGMKLDRPWPLDDTGLPLSPGFDPVADISTTVYTLTDSRSFSTLFAWSF